MIRQLQYTNDLKTQLGIKTFSNFIFSTEDSLAHLKSLQSLNIFTQQGLEFQTTHFSFSCKYFTSE